MYETSHIAIADEDDSTPAAAAIGRTGAPRLIPVIAYS